MNIKSYLDIPCITSLPEYIDDFAIWAEQMDAAYQSDPSSFDAHTGRVIQDMLNGDPVEDIYKLQDEYEAAVLAYKEMFDDMDYEDHFYVS